MKSITKKFLEVMKECNFVEKNGTNSYHGYKYTTCADVLHKVNASLVKHGIVSVAVPELISLTDVKTNKGNIEKLATVQVNISLMDADSDESLCITGIGSGQDSGDKAVMKAETAAIKYAYLLSLAISTGNDPEADSRTDENTSMEGSRNTGSRNPFPMDFPNEKNTGFPRANPSPKTAVCVSCGVPISEKVRNYSMRQFGKPLCMDCQKRHMTA